MTGHWITINAIPGLKYVSSTQILLRRVLKVKREGMGYDIVYSGALTDRQVSHKFSKLTFKNAFLFGEKVYVLIKDF